MPETYTSSAALRTWCERNRNNFYLPEWLLDEWEIRVNADLTGAAAPTLRTIHAATDLLARTCAPGASLADRTPEKATQPALH